MPAQKRVHSLVQPPLTAPGRGKEGLFLYGDRRPRPRGAECGEVGGRRGLSPEPAALPSEAALWAGAGEWPGVPRPAGRSGWRAFRPGVSVAGPSCSAFRSGEREVEGSAFGLVTGKPKGHCESLSHGEGWLVAVAVSQSARGGTFHLCCFSGPQDAGKTNAVRATVIGTQAKSHWGDAW